MVEPPSKISFLSVENVLYVGTEITQLAPHPPVSGENLVFSITPSLPEGLKFNASNGSICGCPLSITSHDDVFTVSVGNEGGKNSIYIRITVIQPVISFKEPIIAVQANLPFSFELKVTPPLSLNSFTISPPLPQGLTLNTSNGTISGSLEYAPAPLANEDGDDKKKYPKPPMETYTIKGTGDYNASSSSTLEIIQFIEAQKKEVDGQKKTSEVNRITIDKANEDKRYEPKRKDFFWTFLENLNMMQLDKLLEYPELLRVRYFIKSFLT